MLRQLLHFFICLQNHLAPLKKGLWKSRTENGLTNNSILYKMKQGFSKLVNNKISKLVNWSEAMKISKTLKHNPIAMLESLRK
ncbi:hypothetical protein CA600_03875 [Paenibacillus sp. VTT E-133280]|nr:hypothetical protein CA600_03875 [Paenibacillus sp. VTT E-133280]